MLHPAPMPPTIEQIEMTIAALEAQRVVLGDAVADIAIAPLRAQLAELTAARSAAPVRQLQMVSVLFLDVVGSTALAGGLDPEQIQTVMDGLLAALSSVVERHGGRVLQYAGDSLLAAFGADEVHEDDAERAVLCGLALARTARSEVVRLGAPALDVRIGISSGSVLTGGGVDGDNSIRGLTVNIAARMEQTAPPGGVRISQDTWRLVRGLFEADEQPPLLVKGRDEPIVTYLVRGPAAAVPAAARRGVDGVRVPMLGREAELARLLAAHAAAGAGASGLQTVLVVADAGLGKTRLLDEFGHWLQGPPRRARRHGAQALERLRGRPYGLLRALLFDVLGLVDVATDPAAWLAAAQPRVGDRAGAAVLGHLLGIDGSAEPEVQALRGDARGLRDRGVFHALQVLGDAVASGLPLVLVLDDVQWADEASLDVIEHLERQAAEWPLLLVLATRAQLFERRPGWAGDAPRRQRIDLVPLDAALSLALVRSLLHELPDAPPDLVQRLADGADGNPFYAEELVNMLVDRGVIDLRTGTVAPQRPGGLELPATLVGVLQARLAALPMAQRRPLQLAAVAGAVFWDAALAALDEAAPGSLTELQARELVHLREASRLAWAREFAFRHQTLHRVTYESVLRSMRRSVHAVLARWMAALPDAASLQDQIAEHHERADEPLLARDAWHAAAEAARLRFANVDALAAAERALALTPPDDLPRRMRLAVLKLHVLETRSERARMDGVIDDLAACAEAAADDGWRSEAAHWRARWLYTGGDAAAALAWGERAVQSAPAGDDERAAQGQVHLFYALTRLARHAEADVAGQRALELAERCGSVQMRAGVLNQLGSMAFDRGDIGAACARWWQALALHRETGHLANQAGTLSNLAFAAMSVGDFAVALGQFEAARELCERVGQQQNQGVVCINLALVLLHLQRPHEARERAERALELLQQPGDRWAQGAALRVAGQALQALGDGAAARERCRASRDLFDELQMPHLAMEAIAVLVEEALARGAIDEALTHVRQIEERRAAGVGLAGTDEPMRIPLARWRALRAAGDPGADDALAQARRELDERAAHLVDEDQRASFLHAVAHHRAIVEGT